MGRKNILDSYPALDAVDISTSKTSANTNVAYTDNIGILIDWTGVSPVGTIVIEVCGSDKQGNASGKWRSLNFGSAISISGNSGQHDITINQLPYSWMRARYTATSGAGSLTLTLTTKQIGG